MKLTQHNDGSYSLTGLTALDVGELALAMGEHEDFNLRYSDGRMGWPGMDASDREHFAGKQDYLRHLARFLWDASHGDTRARTGRPVTFEELHPYSHEAAYLRAKAEAR